MMSPVGGPGWIPVQIAGSFPLVASLVGTSVCTNEHVALVMVTPLVVGPATNMLPYMTLSPSHGCAEYGRAQALARVPRQMVVVVVERILICDAR